MRKSGIRLILLFLVISFTNVVNAQFYTTHYIAPAPWQYASNANEFVISTNSTSIANVTIKKSDGTLIANVTTTKGSPTRFRPSASPYSFPRHPLNTVLNGAGLVFTSNIPISVNIRNVASDQFPSHNLIAGNASLTSFGNSGIGTSYRVGYYRDNLQNDPLFPSFTPEPPIYSIMSFDDNNVIKINGSISTTLNAGQSYLFNTSIGALVESTKPSVMNTSGFIDSPGGCGDGTFDQIPPIQVLGNEYFIIRTTGNSIAEQSTIVASENNTAITLKKFNQNGIFVSSSVINLTNAGDFYTIQNGDGVNSYSSCQITSNSKVVVYVGSAQGCEVDVSTSIPVSSYCNGSSFIETTKFVDYNSQNLPYFGYVLIQNSSAVVLVNGTNIETLTAPRKQLGSTGWYMIGFNNNQLGNPSVLTISSTAKLNVALIQIGGGFSMSATFSNFIEQPDTPSVLYTSSASCSNTSALLTTNSNLTNYQWYKDGVLIPGATSFSYTASTSGNYYVKALLSCGDTSQSVPVSVTITTIASPTALSPQNFNCGVATVANLSATGSNIQWYANATNGSALVAATPLVNGYTYYASQTINGCESSVRLPVLVNVTNSPTPTGTSTQTFCNSATISDLIVTGNNIKWYATATAGNALVATTPLVNGSTYYASQTINGCESSERLSVLVNVTNSPTPTGSSTQTFCNAATIANLVVTGTTIKWYNTASGGTALNSSTPLVNGSTYYATQTVNGCESSVRLPVLVNVTNSPTPTGSSIQTFCNSATISDLIVTGNNIKWYLTASEGTPLPIRTNLVNNTTYYASQTDNNCESLNRLPVLINIITPITPFGESIQYFCKEVNPTIRDLILSYNYDLFFYNSQNSINPLPLDYLLSNNEIIYAASYNSEFFCESLNRFEVKSIVTDSNLEFNNLITIDDNELNKELFIEGIKQFPNNSIEIYNRYGNLVWSAINYDNENNTFKGMANVSGVVAKGNFLPTGTYFFILSYPNDCEKTELKGFIQIDNKL